MSSIETREQAPRSLELLQLQKKHQAKWDELYNELILKWKAGPKKIFDNLPQAMHLLARYTVDLEGSLKYFEANNLKEDNDTVAKQYLKSYARNYAEKYLKHEIMANARNYAERNFKQEIVGKARQLGVDEKQYYENYLKDYVKEYYDNHVEDYAKKYADIHLEKYAEIRADHFCLEFCYFLKNFHTKKEVLSAMEGVKMPAHVIEYMKGEEESPVGVTDDGELVIKMFAHFDENAHRVHSELVPMVYPSAEKEFAPNAFLPDVERYTPRLFNEDNMDKTFTIKNQNGEEIHGTIKSLISDAKEEDEKLTRLILCFYEFCMGKPLDRTNDSATINILKYILKQKPLHSPDDSDFRERIRLRLSRDESLTESRRKDLLTQFDNMKPEIFPILHLIARTHQGIWVPESQFASNVFTIRVDDPKDPSKSRIDLLSSGAVGEVKVVFLKKSKTGHFTLHQERAAEAGIAFGRRNTVSSLTIRGTVSGYPTTTSKEPAIVCSTRVELLPFDKKNDNFTENMVSEYIFSRDSGKDVKFHPAASRELYSKGFTTTLFKMWELVSGDEKLSQTLYNLWKSKSETRSLYDILKHAETVAENIKKQYLSVYQYSTKYKRFEKSDDWFQRFIDFFTGKNRIIDTLNENLERMSVNLSEDVNPFQAIKSLEKGVDNLLELKRKLDEKRKVVAKPKTPPSETLPSGASAVTPEVITPTPSEKNKKQTRGLRYYLPVWMGGKKQKPEIPSETIKPSEPKFNKKS